MAALLNELALVHGERGAHARAEALLGRALRIHERTHGSDHAEIATLLHNLGGVQVAQGRHRDAEPLYQRALQMRERLLGGEHPQVASSLNSLAVLYEEQGAYARAEPLFQRALAIREQQLGANHPAVAALLDNLARLHAHAAPDDPAALRLALTAILRNKGRVLAEVSGEQVVLRRNLSPELQGELEVLAYILEPRGPARWVALGEAEPIEAAITAAQSALVRPGRDAREPLRALDELVLVPIRRQIGSTNHLLLSPDAALHLVPFAALVDEDGRYAVERMRITYVTSGRSLLRAIAPEPARSRPIVVAAPDDRGGCAPLPGAAAEALAVHKHFRDAELHVGLHATKQWLTAARGPLFVHIATHGFLRTPRASSSSAVARAWRDDRDVTADLALTPPPDDPSTSRMRSTMRV